MDSGAEAQQAGRCSLNGEAARADIPFIDKPSGYYQLLTEPSQSEPTPQERRKNE